MKIPSPSQLARMSDDRLLDHLHKIAVELAEVDEHQRSLWAARIAVYQEGRRRDPAITHGRLAEAAGVSEVAIITKLRQLEEREAARTGTG